MSNKVQKYLTVFRVWLSSMMMNKLGRRGGSICEHAISGLQQ